MEVKNGTYIHNYHIVVLCQDKNEIYAKKMRAVQIVHSPMDIWVKRGNNMRIVLCCPLYNHSGIHLREIYITDLQLSWFSDIELGPSIFLLLES